MLGRPGVVPELGTLHSIAKELGMPLRRLIEICGYPYDGDQERLRENQLAAMVQSVPELRSLVETLLTLPSNALAEIQLYTEFYLHRKKQRTKG